MREKELLAYNMRRLRKLNRYSQDAISKYLNISRDTYNSYETLETDIKAFNIFKLAQLYNCSVEEFFYTI